MAYKPLTIAVLSGKGGTGKTLVSVNLSAAADEAVYSDCDVEEPNLHLIFHWSSPTERDDYSGMPKARIDPVKCTGCGQCREHCRFDAIETRMPFRVKPFACEGCGVCAAICPADAVSMEPVRAGELALYKDDAYVFSTAKLSMDSGTSGKLVTEVKKRMISAAGNVELAIIDGSPGIGCPVIASISGVTWC